jgi:transmembrane sensor
MSSPLINEYRKLVSKFLNGKITAEEIRLLDYYYNLFRDVPDVTGLMDDTMAAELEDRLLKGVTNRIKELEKPVIMPLYNRMWFRIAAMLLLFLSITLIVFKKTHSPQYAFKDQKTINRVTAAADRFTILSDGSHVLLHSGSVIRIANNFNKGNTREVTLSGEAYFDIKHNSLRPFIIHTGNITTTVLGTAFVIKAYPGQKNITVTVTRGRVKVTREGALLAILTPNKQLTASLEGKGGSNVTRQVIATKALEWARAGLSFDNMPFSQLAKHLEKRYEVHISFKNQGLSNCPITGSFTGTETLPDVLDILSQTRGTSYHITGKEVIIDGKGCNE